MAKKKTESKKVETPTPEVAEQKENNVQNANKVEDQNAYRTFKDGNGNAIKFHLNLQDGQNLQIQSDFGGVEPESHKGFYSHLAHKFFVSIVGQDKIDELAAQENSNQEK